MIKESIADTSREPRIICIGGGTGLFSLLSGLRTNWQEAHLQAVVAMTDSGGSTGRLRDEFGTLPPGDVRQCLVALSDAPEDLRSLMQYRFASGGDLNGHSLGNLILTAGKKIADDEYAAIEMVERILNVRGKVYPVTLDDTHLVAHLADGTMIRGETRIDRPDLAPRAPIERPSFTLPARLFGKTGDAILSSDAIIIGPGDLYTSVLPNLIVGGVPEALARAQARGAKILYVVNTMTKHGETDGYTARAFVRRIAEAISPAKLDAVIVNDGVIGEAQRIAYSRERAEPVVNDLHDKICFVYAADLVRRGEFARHDPESLAKAVRMTIARIGA